MSLKKPISPEKEKELKLIKNIQIEHERIECKKFMKIYNTLLETKKITEKEYEQYITWATKEYKNSKDLIDEKTKTKK